MTKEAAVQEAGELVLVEETNKKDLIPVSQSGQMFFDVAKFEFAQRVAQVFAKSTMVPEHFRNNIGNCIIALNYAERTGTDPFMCMQKMYIIHGKPAVETTFAVAMFNASGKFTELEFDMDEKKTKCVAYATKVKTGKLIRGPEVSLEMARAEGWMSKQGSKWKTLPEMMLMYRSAIFFIRQYAPEVLLGMMSREEIFDEEDMRTPSQKHKAQVIQTQEDKKKEVGKNVSAAMGKKEPEKFHCARCGAEVGENDESCLSCKNNLDNEQKKESAPRQYADYKAEIEALKGDTDDLKQWWADNKDEASENLAPRSFTMLLNFWKTIVGPEGRSTGAVQPENEITTKEPVNEQESMLEGYKKTFEMFDSILACNKFLVNKDEELRENLTAEEYNDFQEFALQHKAFVKSVQENEANQD